MYKIYKCDPDFSGMLCDNTEYLYCDSFELPIGATVIHPACLYHNDLLYVAGWYARDFIDVIPETSEVMYKDKPVRLIGEDLPILANAIYNAGVLNFATNPQKQ